MIHLALTRNLALARIVSQQYAGWVGPAIDGRDVIWKLNKPSLLAELEPITFQTNHRLSVSITRSGTGNKATVSGGLKVPTAKALKELPLVFSIISTDSLKSGITPTETEISVNPNNGEFSLPFDNLGNSHFFRLKYKWKGAPDPIR